jgi:hypothetical protein
METPSAEIALSTVMAGSVSFSLDASSACWQLKVMHNRKTKKIMHSLFIPETPLLIGTKL